VRRPEDSRSVLITGCSSGIGLETAVATARRGHRVIATMRDPSRDGPLRTAAGAAGVTLTVRALDVTRPETITAVVEEAEDGETGGVDVLVNNAGVGSAGFFEATTDADFHEQLRTNLFGALACTRAVLPGMRARGHGRVVNVSSVAGGSGAPVLSAYTASKFALEGWSECLAAEVRPFGIRVVVVQPGTFRTPIYQAPHGDPADGAGPFARASHRVAVDLVAEVARRGGDPARVGAAVARIVDAPHPRFRHVVGWDARAELWAKRVLPADVHQRLTERLLWRQARATLDEELNRS
jgi:NAD(P)-dependent dehydrogenase (short-subunit alcohol dehydrogenase family)